MKKSDELKKQIENLKKQVEDLQHNEQHDDAAKAAKDLKDAIRDYETEMAVEAVDLMNFQQQAVPVDNDHVVANLDKQFNAKFQNHAFNNALFGRHMTDDEREFVNKNLISDVAGTPGQVGATPAKGGYLVPEEQMNTLREYRRSYTALKDLCNVQTAASTTGKMPTIGEETGKLIEFEELNEINQDDLDFGQLTYTIKDYGDVIPVSNQLVNDADIDIMSLIGQRFARKSINTENEKILALLGELTAQSVTDWKGISKAINVGLDPAISANAKILTNQDGLQFLDELVDTMGRPMLTQSLADPSKLVFRGKDVIVVSNALLASPKSAVPFYIGAFSDYLAFFERKGVEVAVSTEAGFTQYATYLRAVERFGVVKDDAAAVVRLNASTATA